MNKKIIITIGILIILAVGYFLLSPLWNNVKRDDISPLDDQTPKFKDNLDILSPERKSEFDAEVRKMAGEKMISKESPPQKAKLVAEGNFLARAHDVEGSAQVIQTAEGKQILRFEDFQTINGPNLHIYLATELSSRDFIDLGKIKATEGNVNYDLPDNVDLKKYNKVLVWCVTFGVLFSYSDLQLVE